MGYHKWQQAMKLSLIFAAVLILYPAGSARSADQITTERNKSMSVPALTRQTPAVINNGLYGDQTNAAYLPVSVSLKGRQLWETTFVGHDEAFTMQLSLYDEYLVVNRCRAFCGIPVKTGSIKWTLPAQASHASFLNNDGLFTFAADADGGQSPRGILVTPGSGTFSILDLPLPGPSADIQFLARLHTDEYFYCYVHTPSLEEGPASGIRDLALTVYNTVTRTVSWEVKRAAARPNVAATANLERFCFSDANNILTGRVGDTSIATIALNLHPGFSLLGISFDAGDNIVVAAGSEKKTIIIMCSTTGKEQWRVVLPGNQPEHIPPVCTPSGHVIYRAGRKVYGITNGRIVWHYTFDKMYRYPKISSLNNNDILLAIDKKLLQLSSKGKVVASYSADSEITCRPIADREGRVYAATKDKVFCLE